MHGALAEFRPDIPNVRLLSDPGAVRFFPLLLCREDHKKLDYQWLTERGSAPRPVRVFATWAGDGTKVRTVGDWNPASAPVEKVILQCGPRQPRSQALRPDRTRTLSLQGP